MRSRENSSWYVKKTPSSWRKGVSFIALKHVRLGSSGVWGAEKQGSCRGAQSSGSSRAELSSLLLAHVLGQQLDPATTRALAVCDSKLVHAFIPCLPAVIAH